MSAPVDAMMALMAQRDAAEQERDALRAALDAAERERDAYKRDAYAAIDGEHIAVTNERDADAQGYTRGVRDAAEVAIGIKLVAELYDGGETEWGIVDGPTQDGIHDAILALLPSNKEKNDAR
jgi:hypothetical protein